MSGRESSFEMKETSSGGSKRAKSQIRFAVEDTVERHSSNSLDKLQLSNNIGDSGSNPGSFQSSRNNSNSPSNPSANMKRNTLSISKRTLSVSQIQQFQAQQQDKYDTLVLKLGKGFFGAFVLLVCTCALILSKSSLIYMADKANVYGVGYKPEEFGRYIVQILSILMLPLFSTVFSDLMYFWVRETKEKKRDPKSKRVKPHTIMLLAYLEGIIEAVGISIFIMMVFPLEKVDNIAKIFLLNGLCVIPVISALAMKWKKWLKPQKNVHVSNTQDSIDLTDPEIGFGEKKKKDGVDYCSRLVVTAVQVLFLLMQLAGMGLYMYKFGLWWEIPVSLILCSISYWKNYVFIERLEPHWSDAYKRNRYATSCVKTIAKITFIFVCVIVIAKVKYSLEPSLYLDHNFVFDSIIESSGLHYSLLGSWVAYYMVWMACLACMQITCFALPVLLTTPLTVFWQTWQCKDYIFGDGTIGTCSGFSSGSLSDTLIIAGGILMWVSFIIVSGHLWAGIDKRDANQLDEDMWAQPETINCLFMEESLALNRNRNPKVVKSLDGEMEYGFHAHRTYITTTMYHESKTEMQKLVMSLLQIDAEIPAEDKIADYYEAHIIFDDAFLKQPNLKPNNFDYSPYYNEWVFYLLEIFQDLKLKKLGDAVVVWYGEVLTFKFALGMKLVVHLKDVSKIRQKKRWSQILYMHSILEDVLDDENKIGMLDSNTFILMIDGDTQFTRKSVNLMRFMIELDRERSGAICGRIFPEGASNPVVWYQKFEYAVGHWFQKTAEHVFGSVLCSPGCFSLVRIAALYRRSGENMDGQNCAIETYAKEIESAMDVLKFDQGEDRMLSTLIIKNGWRLQYCAGAEAGTFCPEGFGDFFKQRRRWISSTLANLYFLIASSSDIVKINSSVSPPYILYTAGVFASSIFGPATVVLVVIGGMGYAFNWQGTPSYVLGLGLPLGYAAICIIFNLNMETDTSRKKSKKIDIQVGAAFFLCALYALLMAAVVVGVAAQMVDEIGGPDSIFLLTLIGTFVVSSTLHGEFFLLTYGIVYLFFLPTMYLILIMFAVANIHDQSWGTRDGSGGGKESDADKFFSISKLGAYIREIKDSFREALYDEQVKKPKKVDEEEENKFGWRTYGDEGKEEIMILEEERRRIEEEKKKQEEEKKKQEEERKLREIERQKEEARKKKIEADEREKLQERLKQERRRGIHHPYKDHLSALSRRLKNKVATPDKGNEKDVAAEKLERVRQLASLQQMCCFMLFLCSVIWLILVVTVGVHPELKFLETNAVGILFLISFGIIMIFQFLASILHRMETMFNALANIPMTFDCTMVEKGNKYERLIKKQMAQQDEPAPKEGVAAKVARKLLLVDKRTATKANLLN